MVCWVASTMLLDCSYAATICTLSPSYLPYTSLMWHVFSCLATASLRACLLELRKHPLRSEGTLADTISSSSVAFPPPLVHLLAAAAQVVDAVLGATRVGALLTSAAEGLAADVACAALLGRKGNQGEGLGKYTREREWSTIYAALFMVHLLKSVVRVCVCVCVCTACDIALAAVVAGVGEALTHLELEVRLLQEMFQYYCVHYKEEREQESNALGWEGIGSGRQGEGRQPEQELLWVHALLDSLEACLHQGVVDCFSSPALLTHPLSPEDDDTADDTLAPQGHGHGQGQTSPPRRRAASSGRVREVRSPDVESLSLSLAPAIPCSSSLSASGRVRGSEQQAATLVAQQSSLLILTEALRGVTAKKESLFSLRAEDVQEDYEEDPYAYPADYSYDYSQQQGEGEGGQYEPALQEHQYQHQQYTEEEKQLWTEEERELYEWQQSQGLNQSQQELQYDELEGGGSSWDDAVDWVQHYDESSQQYFYFSESLQESRWE